MDVEAARLAEDVDVSLAIARRTVQVLRDDLSREEDELEAVDREFRKSLSYRIGSMLCPNFRS